MHAYLAARVPTERATENRPGIRDSERDCLRLSNAKGPSEPPKEGRKALPNKHLRGNKRAARPLIQGRIKHCAASTTCYNLAALSSLHLTKPPAVGGAKERRFFSSTSDALTQYQDYVHSLSPSHDQASSAERDGQTRPRLHARRQLQWTARPVALHPCRDSGISLTVCSKRLARLIKRRPARGLMVRAKAIGQQKKFGSTLNELQWQCPILMTTQAEGDRHCLS